MALSLNVSRGLAVSIGAFAVVGTIAGVVAWRGGAAPPLPEVCLAVDDAPSAPDHGMVWIAGGRFRMGSEQFRAEEAPVREKAVEGFWIDQHDVTNAQFARFVRETGYTTTAERSASVANGAEGGEKGLFSAAPGAWVFVQPSEVRDLQDIGQWWRFTRGADWRHPEGPRSGLAGRQNHPVVQVSFADAQAYARWAGRALPSEAQWEFAARGGREGESYVWGDAPDSDDAPMANHWRGIFPVLNLGSKGFRGTSPVGCFPPNGYGLSDMAGNVWQWTRTIWSEDHVPTDTTAPSGGAGVAYVIKGGSFLCGTNFCMRYRPAARQPANGIDGAQNVGFRTVLERQPVR